MSTTTVSEIGQTARAVRRQQAKKRPKPRRGSQAAANIEIGQAEKSVRRRGASSSAKPIERATPAAKTPDGGNAEPVKRMAKVSPQTIKAAPSSSPIHAGGDAEHVLPTATPRAKPKIETQSAGPIHPAGNGEGKSMLARSISEPNDAAPASTDITEIVADIVRNQRLRKFAITSQSRCDRSVESLISTMLGYDPEADEKERRATFAKAKAFRALAEKGNASSHPLANSLCAIIPAILANATARAPWDDLRLKAEKEMARLAELLPIGPFVQTVRGLGAVGTAILVAEAGIPIGDYRTPSGLWKRLGLGTIDGEAQRRVSGEAAIAHGYSPDRRAQVWAVCSDSMFRAQWRGAKDEDGKDPIKTGKPATVPAHAIGAYGEVYGRRRERTKSRDPEQWPKARCMNDAKRIMTKALMLDLWLVWRGLAPVHAPWAGDAGEAA